MKSQKILKTGKIYNGIIKEVDGEKVGFFGLTTEETEESFKSWKSNV